MTTPSPKPLTSKSQPQRVVDSLQARILACELKPGDRIPPEPLLMQEFSVSRTVVREAMSSLQASGFVKTRHGIGTFVLERAVNGGLLSAPPPELHVKQTLAMLELRISLEVESAGLAALRRTDEDLAALREALGTSGSHYHGDLDTYIACDLVFHRRLVDAAHNPTLSELYRYFSSIVGAQLRQTLNIVPRRQEVFDLHIELLDAVEQRDPERAKALSRQLINEP